MMFLEPYKVEEENNSIRKQWNLSYKSQTCDF